MMIRLATPRRKGRSAQDRLAGSRKARAGSHLGRSAARGQGLEVREEEPASRRAAVRAMVRGRAVRGEETHEQDDSHDDRARALRRGRDGGVRRHVGKAHRAVEQLCRQLLASGDADQLGDRDQAGRRGRDRGRGRRLHHGREPGDRAGGADPEHDPGGLRRHRRQRRLARRR